VNDESHYSSSWDEEYHEEDVHAFFFQETLEEAYTINLR